MAETILIDPDFRSWRKRARDLLAEGIPPPEVFWNDTASRQGELFVGEAPPEKSPSRVRDDGETFRVPRPFVNLAEAVSCHSSPERWGLLYRLLWRQTRGGERRLLAVATDPDVRRASLWAGEVGRDVHKMRAFVRFRKVGESEAGREQFVAWFEPLHRIVRRNAPFFRKRFTGMDWSILTPSECVHWDGRELRFTPGVSAKDAPDDDALEELWRSYYASIFNPSRLKLKAMRAEMPARYWKNLPEAPLIHSLSREASHRREEMVAKPAIEPRSASKNLYLESLSERNAVPTLNEPPAADRAEDLPDLRRMRSLAECCRACPLWERATRTVFGEGNPEADLMIVGEQPGDREDLEGRPFVGPAGELLDEILEEVGARREDVYVTNAVKHFKWKPPASGTRGAADYRRGKTRLHDKANRAEMKACRPWLLGEIAKVKPKVVLTLGNTAGQSLIDPEFRVTRDRGEREGLPGIDFAGRVFATVHPAFLLRIPERERQAEERERFRDEVAAAAEAARE